VTFYWHWKHITLVTNNLSLWTESSTYLMVWDWMFLFGHLIWAEKPVALSIVQARFVGLAHFAMGHVLTYRPFVMASSSSYM
jgi:photosystem I P700 chlorophyll a apoprotein A2